MALLLMGEDEFREIVAEAIDALPDRFRAEVGRTVEFIVELEMGPEHIAMQRIPADPSTQDILVRRHGWKPENARRASRPMVAEDIYPAGPIEIYGLYSGVMLPDRARAGLAVVFPPSVVTIFMGPVLRANVDEDALRFQVRNLVEHEMGHHFGLTEEEIGRAHDRKRSGERKHPGY